MEHNQFVATNKLEIMKKSILNLGKSLNKLEQKTINGGLGRANMGDCLVPDPDNNNEPLLVGHVPCDGVSMCPAQPDYGYNSPYPPMCFAF